MNTSIAIMGNGMERSTRPTSVLDPRRDSDIAAAAVVAVVIVRRALIGVAALISLWC